MVMGSVSNNNFSLVNSSLVNQAPDEYIHLKNEKLKDTLEERKELFNKYLCPEQIKFRLESKASELSEEKSNIFYLKKENSEELKGRISNFKEKLNKSLSEEEKASKELQEKVYQCFKDLYAEKLSLAENEKRYNNKDQELINIEEKIIKNELNLETKKTALKDCKRNINQRRTHTYFFGLFKTTSTTFNYSLTRYACYSENKVVFKIAKIASIFSENFKSHIEHRKNLEGKIETLIKEKSELENKKCEIPNLPKKIEASKRNIEELSEKIPKLDSDLTNELDELGKKTNELFQNFMEEIENEFIDSFLLL